MTDAVNLCLIQDRFLVGDIKANTRKILSLSRQASDAGADIVVFPELALSGYPPEDLLLRSSFMRQINDAIVEITDQSSDALLVFGSPCVDKGKLYNAAIVCHQGQLVGRYCKQSLPNYSVFDEKRYFESGQEALVIDSKQRKLGIIICEDAWTEAPARQAKEQGAEALILLNASPYHMNKHQQRMDMLQQRHAELAHAHVLPEYCGWPGRAGV